MIKAREHVAGVGSRDQELHIGVVVPRPSVRRGWEGSLSRIYLSPPDAGPADRAALLDAFDSNWIAPLGPHVDAFERETAAICGVEHAAALSSGTAALHLSLILAGVEPGDAVVCSTFTFAATAFPIAYCGAVPAFVDSDETTWNMNPELLREALTDLRRRGAPVKAVIAVDLYGQCADYDRIVPLCEEFGVSLIEDAAEALGASWRGRPAGSFGRMAALSFNGNKIITTSGGGMLLSNDGDLIRRARFLATQARDPAPHYQHSTVGYNYRMSNLLAAVGRGQLSTLVARVEKRRAIFGRYVDAFAAIEGIGFMPEPEASRSNRWLTCITIDPSRVGVTREDVRLALEAENIESRPLWKPMHLQPIYADAPIFGTDVSERLFDQGLCLPSGSSLTSEQQALVIDIVRERITSQE